MRRALLGGRATVAALALAALAPQLASADYVAEGSTTFGAIDGTQQGKTVSCPVGLAIGGGASSGTNSYVDDVYLNTSRPEPAADPIGTDWVIWLDNYTGGAANHPASAWAMCDTAGDPGDYTIRHDGVPVDDGKQKGAVASCKGDEAVVGGGGRSFGVYTDETYLSTSAPVDDGDSGNVPDDGWKATLNNDEGGAPVTNLDVYAVCDRKHPASRFDYPKETRTIPDATQRGRTVSCGNRALVGGGVSSAADYKHGLYIGSSQPYLATKWYATVANYETPDGKTRQITVTAICRK